MSLSRLGLSIMRGVRKSSSASNVHPGYAKLSGTKEKFSIEDGTPMYKKGGAFDNVLFGLTFIISAGGVGLCFKTYYDFSLK